MVTLFFYQGEWLISCSDSSDCSTKLNKSSVASGIVHYRYPSKTIYNAWNFFFEDMMQIRNSYLTNVSISHKHKDTVEFSLHESEINTMADLFWKIFKQKGKINKN